MRNLRLARVVVLCLIALLTACSTPPPDRRQQVDDLTQSIGDLPGVGSATGDVANSFAQNLVYLKIRVEVADDVTADQLAAVVNRYLDGLRDVDYTGYRTELRVTGGPSTFAVDSTSHHIDNGDQIIEQARSWVELRREFPGASVDLSATVSHPAMQLGPDGGPPAQARPPDTGHPSLGAIQLADSADYQAVAAGVSILSAKHPQLADGDWTISAGKQHPADIRTSRRLPNAREMDVWARLNADQTIPHADALTINGYTGQVWFAEQTRSRELDVALELARQHLAVVAALQAPVLYTASDQIQGHLGFNGQATGPVAILVGGCLAREYRPGPAEQSLIAAYEKCPR